MGRVPQRLAERSRRTPTALFLLMLLGAFQPPKPATGGPATFFPWAENKNCEHRAMSGGYNYKIQSSGFGG